MQDTRNIGTELERRVRPLAATATALASGWRDSHGASLPNLEGRLRGVRDDAAALAEWVRDHVPEMKPSRRERR